MAVNYNRLEAGTVPAINNELEKIQVALEDAVSRTGVGPNQLEATLDANSQRIINLPKPGSNSEPARYGDVEGIVSGFIDYSKLPKDAQFVDSLINLLSIDTDVVTTIITNGFYPNTTVGGGHWKIVKDTDLAQNNGGTFVSKSALQAWYDAAVLAGGVTTANLKANLDVLFTAGTGTGDAFVRINGSVYPYHYGAALDGTDDTTSIEKYLSEASDGDTLDFLGKPFGYNSNNFTITGKKNLTIKGGGSRILELSQTTNSSFIFDNCDNIRIHGFRPEGAETQAYWQANSPATRAFFFLVKNSKKPKVWDINSSNKRSNVKLEYCTSGVVHDCNMDGFMQDLDLGVVSGANNCPNVEVSGGSRNKAYNNDAENHGSTVLGGLNTAGLTAFGNTGYNLHDNVVYLSSGTRGRIWGNDGEKIKGQIAKARGSLNIVFGNTGTDGREGDAIAITGNGGVETLDSYGANGHGNIAALNSADNYGQDVSGGGVNASIQDGYYQRDSIVALNAFDDCGSIGAYAVISSTQVKGGIVVMNSVGVKSSDWAIRCITPTELNNQGIRSKNNLLFGNNAYGNYDDSQYRVQDIDDSLVIGNISDGKAGSTGINCRFVNNSIFNANINYGGSRVVALSGVYPSEGNLLCGNMGITGGYAGTNGYADNKSTQTSSWKQPTDTPAFIGEVLVDPTTSEMYIGALSTFKRVDNI